LTAKKYLEQTRFIDIEIRNKIKQLEIFRESLFPITVCNDGMPKGETACVDGLSKAVARVVDLEREINEMVDRLIDLKLAINRTIQALEEPKHRIVLEERYLLFKCWSEIAATLNCSVRQVHRYHHAALKEINLAA